MKKKNKELPNADAARFPTVPELCDGCSKSFSVSEDASVCEVYVDPTIWLKWDRCPFNIKLSAEEKKMLNPIKASKRRFRR